MTKAPTSVRSIRLPDDTWALLAAQAKAHKMSVNAWVALNLTVHACAAAAWRPIASTPDDSQWSDEEVAALRARPRAPLVINKIGSAKPAERPAPFKTRLKGEWKAP